MGEAVEHFSYDLVGNRTTDAKTGTNQWGYNKNNELQSFDTTSFKYNLNGQMTEKTVAGIKTNFSYNLDGRLSEIRDSSSQVIAQYEYNPFGRRLSKTLPQNNNKVIYFHYGDEGLIAEYDETGQLIQSYGYKPNSLFTTNPLFTHRPDYTEEKGYAFYINDHLATPQKLILRNGRKVWEASADSFGKTTITNNEFINPLRFPGQYKDDESTLRYNYFRYYDYQLGRYITSDPIGLKGGLNTYAYVMNNPVLFKDIFGLQCLDCIGRCTRCEQDCLKSYSDGMHDDHNTVHNGIGTCRQPTTNSLLNDQAIDGMCEWNWLNNHKHMKQFRMKKYNVCMSDCYENGCADCDIGPVKKYNPPSPPRPNYTYPPDLYPDGTPPSALY